MKIIYSILFTICMHVVSAQVGGERIYNFLNIPTSAKQAALGGETLTIANDVNQALWNPSVISNLKNNQLAVNYVNFLTDINIGSATFSHLINDKFGTIHAGVQYIDYGDFIGADEEGNETGEFTARDLALSVGYAYHISNSDFYVGSNVKFLSSKIENSTSQGAAVDFGAYYFSESKPYAFTAVIRNIGYQFTVYDEERESLPLEIAVGGSYKSGSVPVKWHLTLNNLQKWNIAVHNPSDDETDIEGNVTTKDINFLTTTMRHIAFGGEFFPDGKFNLRFGYNFRRGAELNLTEARSFAGFTAGFGLKMKKIKLGYAYTKYHPAENTSTFTLHINLDK